MFQVSTSSKGLLLCIQILTPKQYRNTINSQQCSISCPTQNSQPPAALPATTIECPSKLRLVLLTETYAVHILASQLRPNRHAFSTRCGRGIVKRTAAEVAFTRCLARWLMENSLSHPTIALRVSGERQS